MSMDHLNSYGYTITREFCGYPGERHVVRQYGDWVSSHSTRDEALVAITARGGVYR